MRLLLWVSRQRCLCASERVGPPRQVVFCHAWDASFVSGIADFHFPWARLLSGPLPSGSGMNRSTTGTNNELLYANLIIERRHDFAKQSGHLRRVACATPHVNSS